MFASPLVPLVFFALWAVLLGLSVLTVRTTYLLTGALSWDDVPSGSPHGPVRYWRLNRAHINALENLPIFASVTVAAVLLPADAQTVTGVAWLVFAARVAQSCVHVLSTVQAAVVVRAGFYIVQALGMAAIGATAVLAALPA